MSGQWQPRQSPRRPARRSIAPATATRKCPAACQWERAGDLPGCRRRQSSSNGPRFSRRLDADLGDGAEALVVEATVFGRRAMGEAVGHAMFRDRWRIRHNGRLTHAEDFAIGPDVAGTLSRAAVTGGAIAVATVLLICDDAPERLEAARAIVGDDGEVSAWSVAQSGKLLARLFADGQLCAAQAAGAADRIAQRQAGLPKIWSL